MPSVPLHERLREYAALTAAERAEVDALVESRPDLHDAWTEARALAAVIDAARAPDDLTAQVVDESLGLGRDAPPAPDERAALEHIAEELEDPLAQFERLTGHALPPPLDDHSGDGRPAERPARLAGDRGAVQARPRLARRFALSVVALVGLYGAAFATSSLTTPERVRVAEVSDVSTAFRPVRGAELSDRYAEAVSLLEGAQTSTLGLFPRTDADRLDAAADAFAEIAREAPDDGFGKEAALALGRIRLLQGRDEEARVALDAVMAQGGYRAPDAARLLDYLDEQAR